MGLDPSPPPLLYNPEGLSKDQRTPARTERLSPCVAVRCSVLHTHLPNDRVFESLKHKVYTLSCTGVTASVLQCIAVSCRHTYQIMGTLNRPNTKHILSGAQKGYSQCVAVRCSELQTHLPNNGDFESPKHKAYTLLCTKRYSPLTLGVSCPQSGRKSHYWQGSFVENNLQR